MSSLTCWVSHAQVVKKTHAKLQIRSVQPAVVAQWTSRIEGLAKDIARIAQVCAQCCHRPSCAREQVIAVHALLHELACDVSFHSATCPSLLV